MPLSSRVTSCLKGGSLPEWTVVNKVTDAGRELLRFEAFGKGAI